MDTPPAPIPDPVPAAATTTEVVVSEDKTVAIVSYLTLIGFIVAVVLHGNKKTKLGAYHLRQSLGLMITFIGLWIVNMILAFIPVIGWILIPIVWLGMFVLWLIGLINAAGGKMKPVPVLGDYYQKWFASTFE
ncbi:MAG TPA: DUF4870 domain-containing protein [Opitutus sp.]|nr:DUF4870 domain-containing protein [Opitutus sp.]